MGPRIRRSPSRSRPLLISLSLGMGAFDLRVSFVVGVDYEFGIGVNEMKPLLIARLYRQSILSIHKLINQLSS